MPRRLGTNSRLWVYRYLVLRDGERCARCFEIPTPRNTLFGTLDIDHQDHNPTNWDPTNLRLLCHPCNVTLENKARSPTPQNELPSDQRERERAEGKPATRVVREEVNYKQGAPEMQANFLFEVDFRTWLLGKVQEHGNYPKTDAIDAGAEVVGCSPSTTTKYLAKLTSSAGPLKESKDMLGGIHLELKDQLKPEPTIFVDLDKLVQNRGENESKEKLDTILKARAGSPRLPLS